MRNPIIDVAVIGGGAAGMMASITAARLGYKVTLFEHNDYLGKKLGITGKGRCNLTNACSVREFMENVPVNSRFLYSAVNRFTPDDTMAFFEELGVPVTVERGKRVFPVSQKARDVVFALKNEIVKRNIRIKKCEVLDIETSDGCVSAIVTDAGRYACKTAILCTGGASYPLTGSTGDGYKIAQRLGHTIVEPKPSLVPLECYNGFCADMQGLSLKNVTLSVYRENGKPVFSELGEMLFTHFGVSGPLVLSASCHMPDVETNAYYGLIDLKPGLDEKKLDARILRDFEKYSNRDIQNALCELLNKRMIPVVVGISEIPPETKANSVTKAQRQKLLGVIKGLRLDFMGKRPVSEAIITSGGVSVREINPTTMESKIVKGLHFAGEIIDVDAYTGGFNLQIAWSTGYAAGNSVEVY